ncbi:Protein PEROXIN-4 [Platanthera guangdongensis]|uniref:Protein PEROXIN-4 n=1 Tax=Platanthera guangdongensis TaxID=2320717 RepID=A0ABR2LEG6_9ASPA
MFLRPFAARPLLPDPSDANLMAGATPDPLMSTSWYKPATSHALPSRTPSSRHLSLPARSLLSPQLLFSLGNLLRSGDIRGYQSMARMYTRLAAIPKKG